MTRQQHKQPQLTYGDLEKAGGAHFANSSVPLQRLLFVRNIGSGRYPGAQIEDVRRLAQDADEVIREETVARLSSLVASKLVTEPADIEALKTISFEAMRDPMERVRRAGCRECVELHKLTARTTGDGGAAERTNVSNFALNLLHSKSSASAFEHRAAGIELLERCVELFPRESYRSTLLPEIIDAVYDDVNFYVRKAGVCALGRLAERWFGNSPNETQEEAVPFVQCLATAAHDPAWPVRREVAHALQYIPLYPEVVISVLHALHTPDEETSVWVVKEASRAFGRLAAGLGARRTRLPRTSHETLLRDFLSACAEDRDESVRYACAFHLPGALECFLNGPNEETRESDWGPIRTSYLTLCEDGSNRVRATLAASTGAIAKTLRAHGIKPETGEELLASQLLPKFLDDEDDERGGEIRVAAFRSLLELAEVPPSLDSLHLLLSRLDAAVERVTRSSSTGCRNFRASVARQLPTLISNVSLALKKSGTFPPPLARTVTRLCGDPAARVRHFASGALIEAIEAAETMGDRETAATFRSFLLSLAEAPHFAQRSLFPVALASSSLSTGSPWLVNRDETSEEGIKFRESVVNALDKLGRSDPVVSVRTAVAELLSSARLSTASLEPRLEDLKNFLAADADVMSMVVRRAQDG